MATNPFDDDTGTFGVPGGGEGQQLQWPASDLRDRRSVTGSRQPC